MATNAVGFLEQHRTTIDEFLSSPESPGKNPVSLLMELGALMKVAVSFKDTQQIGLSHQKMFTCETRMGPLRCTGTAHSKKEAKKNAAEQAIRILKSNSKIGEKTDLSVTPSKYIPLTVATTSHSTEHFRTLKIPNSPCSPSSPDMIDSPSTPGSNIIGKLQELAVSNSWTPPEYELVNDTGQSHDKTFIMECKIEDWIAQGLGKNKKTAKRLAAENMLSMLQEKEKSRSHATTPDTGSLSPGMSPHTKCPVSPKRSLPVGSSIDTSRQTKQQKPNFLASYIFSECFDEYSDDDDFLIDLNAIPSHGRSDSRSNIPDDETFCQSLKERAEKSGFKVEYLDLKEKAYSGKFQCFVRLSTDPIAVLCGSGVTQGASHAVAAYNALQYLDIIPAS